MKKVKSKKILIIALIVMVILCIFEMIHSNTYIEVENIIVNSQEIPQNFDDVKIAHISDYHNKSNYDKLIELISENEVNYIFITGDITDGIRPNTKKSIEFLEKVSKVAPCYMVWGNHDFKIGDNSFNEVKKYAEENGITILENEFTYLERDNEKILLTGTDGIDYEEMLKNYPEDEIFSMWLHHYPEDFKTITDDSLRAENQVDLLFTGHAHGGLIRLPFIDGLYAPGQSFFPEYTSGRYELNGSQMIVSRGVGNSGYTKRFADPFHLIICTLQSE